MKVFFISFFIYTSLLHSQDGLNGTGGASVGINDTGGLPFSASPYLFQDIKSNLIGKDGDFEISLDDILGSPYLYEDFQQGVIRDMLEETYRKVFVRYNIFNDDFQIKYDSPHSKAYNLIKDPKVRVELNYKTFVYKTFIDENKEVVEGFLELFYFDEYISIFKRYRKKLDLPKKAETSLHKDIPGRFVDKNSFFVSKGLQIVVLPENRKTIINFFPNHKEELEHYIKNERLRFKKEEDVKKLIRYYKSL